MIQAWLRLDHLAGSSNPLRFLRHGSHGKVPELENFPLSVRIKKDLGFNREFGGSTCE